MNETLSNKFSELDELKSSTILKIFNKLKAMSVWDQNYQKWNNKIINCNMNAKIKIKKLKKKKMNWPNFMKKILRCSKNIKILKKLNKN